MIIESSFVDLDTPTGVMRTYVHKPKTKSPVPAVLFYSEIFQQTGPIERFARFLAGHGFAVLVPEVFHELNPIGTVLAYDDAGRDKGNADKSAKTVEHYDSDNRAMIEWLGQQDWYSGALGAAGVCIGGHLAFRAALQPEVAAASCFYATDLHTNTIPNTAGQHSMERAQEIKGELLMIWGKQDPHIPPTARAGLYTRFAELGLDYTWHEFNGQHAFMRDEGDRFDAELQRLGLELTLALFNRTLR
ncbi:dienelactone hydrolase family protein [Chitinibacteraceae bacterium HSL-7]